MKKSILLTTFLSFFILLCSSNLFAQSIDYSSNKDIAIANDLITVSNIYPNPSTNFVNFDYYLPPETSHAKIVIHNILGSIMGQYELKQDNQIRISVNDLKSGIYFYTITVGNQNLTTKKFIVRR
jgi:hypothetical protein